MKRASEGAEQWMRTLLQLQGVERKISPPGRHAPENDVEHSYHLAMMAWFLNETCGLGLDVGEVLKYALVHDLAEVYAGDPLPTDVEAQVGKAAREAEALDLICRENGDGAAGIVSTAMLYESSTSKEARFVHALDKLMPRLLAALGGVSQPLEEGEKVEAFDRAVWAAVSSHPVVLELYREFSPRVYERYGQQPPGDLYPGES